MGRITTASPIGDVKGKVGPIVMSTWKAIAIVKSLPIKKRSTKPSEKQVQENTAFSTVMQFLWPVLKVINIGFQMPRNAKMSPLNRATSYHMLHAVAGWPNKPSIDMAKIKFSRPIKSTQCAWNAVLSAEEGRIIKITWELNPFPLKCTQLNDRAVFILYDSELDWLQEVLSADLERETLIFTTLAPKRCAGHEWFAYMLMVSEDGKLVSETEYLGMVKVLA